MTKYVNFISSFVSTRYSKSVYNRNHFCWTIHSGVLSHGCCPLQDQVTTVIISSHRSEKPAATSMWLFFTDMQWLEWCCPGCGHLCGTLHLCSVGEVTSWRVSTFPALLTGTAGMLGTCPTSSYTSSFASPCPSPSLWCPTYDSCGPSVRLPMERDWMYIFVDIEMTSY